MEPLQADQDEAMAWIKKGRGLTAARQTQMLEGPTCDVSGVIVEMCII